MDEPTVQESPSSSVVPQFLHIAYTQSSVAYPLNLSTLPFSLTSATSFPVLGALAVAVVILIALAFSRRRRFSTRASSILLTGPPDSGKTAIHSALVFQQVPLSHTTLQTNISLINVLSPDKLNQRVMRLIDVPGHPRVRAQFKDYLLEAKAVVFVTDASTITRNSVAVAEHLHHVLHALTSLPPSQKPPQLVILAHKYDAVSSISSSSNAALAVSRVRTILERELEKRRASQVAGIGVGQLGNDQDKDSELGGLECSETGVGGFRFKDWEGGEVEIIGSSLKIPRGSADAKKESEAENTFDGLAEFTEWIQALP